MRPPERIAAAARQARSCRSLCDRVDQQSLRGFQTDGERVGHTRRAQRGGNGMESRSSCVRRHAGAPTRGPSQNGAMSVVTLPFGRLCRRFGAGDGARLRGRVLGFQHDTALDTDETPAPCVSRRSLRCRTAGLSAQKARTGQQHVPNVGCPRRLGTVPTGAGSRTCRSRLRRS